MPVALRGAFGVALFLSLLSPAAAQMREAPPPVRAGALTIDAPWIRATPAAAPVAGGYLRVTNGGTEPDRLVSASVPIATRGEIHEMSNEGGVMRMRELGGGLAIPPGGTVELRPGGLHIMFTGLRAPARPGDVLRGTLTFERAGTVAVAFPVAGMGASGPPGAAHAHH